MADYVFRRGLVHWQMRQPSLALKDFDTALQLEPAHVEARLRRAMLRAGEANRQGTLDDLQLLDKSLAQQASRHHRRQSRSALT